MFTMFGVPHSLVIVVSWPRCHGEVVAQSLGSAVLLPIPFGSKLSWSRMKTPPGPSPFGSAERGDVNPVGAAVHRVGEA